MGMDQVVVHAQELMKRFGGFTAVAGIDFDVQRGEIFGFLGPNGSGKTTTIRMMLGLLQPTEGIVETLGVKVSQHPERIRSRVGYMSQQFSLYNDLTVIENLRFYGRAYGLKNRERHARLENALEMAGMAGRENRRTRDLSGGWRQRLALAAAILHRPELLFLDEPTAGVDPVSRRAFWELLYQLVAEGTTVFVTTHYMEEAEHCHRLAFLQPGKIIACGSPEERQSKIMPGQVLEIEPDNPTEAVKTLRKARDESQISLDNIDMYGSMVHVVSKDVENQKENIREILRQAAIDPGRMEVIEPSLEDVFVACMQ